FEKLKKELNRLKDKRALISKTIGEAREEGDLKENAGYHAAKEEQGLNEMRIRDLETKVENAEIVSKDKVGRKDRVTLGSTAKIINLDSKEEYEYQLVPSIDADILEGKVSTDSPIGEALAGAQIGEVFEIDAPIGLIKYKVTSIS
ncbi:MAG: transcription elongation factor GreA, partial [bacterium]